MTPSTTDSIDAPGSAKELLLKAADLIESPSRWTRGTLARDRTGMMVDPTHASACRWCALGAIDKLAPDADAAMAAMRLAENSNRSLTTVNDRRGMTAKRMAAFLRKAAMQ